MLIEEREDGILMRPAVTTPVEVEIYTPERLAEFFLNNVLTKQGYLEARRDVEQMGIHPDSIDHIRGLNESCLKTGGDSVSRCQRTGLRGLEARRRNCSDLADERRPADHVGLCHG